MLLRQAVTGSTRSLSCSARLKQQDLIQAAFVQKIRQYAEKQKSAPDGLVDSNADVQRGLADSLNRLASKYHLASKEDVSRLAVNFQTANVESAVEPLIDAGKTLAEMTSDVKKSYASFVSAAEMEKKQAAAREAAMAGGAVPEHVPEGMRMYLAEHGVKWPLDPPELMEKISGEELVCQIAWEEQAQAHLPVEMVRDIDGNKVMQKMLAEPEKMRARLTDMYAQMPWRMWMKRPFVPDLCYRDEDGTPHTNNRIAHWFPFGPDLTVKDAKKTGVKEIQPKK